MVNNIGVLILSGYNNRAVIAFIRFCKKCDIPFSIVSAGLSDSINDTAYKEDILTQRSDSSLSVSNFFFYKELLKSKRAFNEIIVLPTSEYLNRFLLKERTALEKAGFVIPLVDEFLYNLISDKYSFSELCKSHDILTPNEYATLEKAEPPFVAKPCTYFSKNGEVNSRPILIYTKKEKDRIRERIAHNEFYFQKFVGGKSYYLLYYFNKEQSYSVYSQQNMIQQDRGLSIIGAESSDFHKRSIAEKFASIFRKNKFRGWVMIEVKLYEGLIYMIEANPRLWGPSQLILDSGMDLFALFAIDYGLLSGDKKENTNYKTKIKYFWNGGISEMQRKKLNIVFHDYSEDQFNKEFEEWMDIGVYRRSDTLKVYFNEMGVGNDEKN